MTICPQTMSSKGGRLLKPLDASAGRSRAGASAFQPFLDGGGDGGQGYGSCLGY